ncbi:MAG TPA: MBL fold metallo-hydrolase, partial [Gemmatimonadaceae bacterium]|nr:MBL fold metallo-hydrolase [Gemmatimonadaceae bacterium]
GVLVDAGFPGVAPEFGGYLDRARPRGVILTHFHEDHAGNAELVARRGIPIAAASDTVAALRAAEQIGLYRRLIWGNVVPLRADIVPFQPGGLILVHTPGHSADHHVVWDAETGTLFSGDLFLGVKVRVAHPAEDPRLISHSVRAAASLGPRRMFDAHRGLVPNPVGALRAKADWLDETIAAIERRIAEGRPDRAIAREILGREELPHYISLGGLSRINIVRAVRRTEARGKG